MKLAAVQMVATPRVADNLARASALVAEAAQRGAELVALPEYFCLMGLRDRDKVDIAEVAGDATAPIQAALAAMARNHGVWLVGGTLPLQVPGDADHAFNTSLVFSPTGEAVARYDKIHLFRFDDGERRYDESTALVPGVQPVAFEARSRAGDAHRVGLSICYDLRFPELYRALMAPPADLLVVPAAFTYPTGEAHWELLLRARAVENQCYVLAPAQGGRHENGRRTWGHSMIVDPWGRVLDVLPEGEGVVLAELDPAVLRQVRTQLPALTHRVPGLKSNA
jgi:nitrilase